MKKATLIGAERISWLFATYFAHRSLLKSHIGLEQVKCSKTRTLVQFITVVFPSEFLVLISSSFNLGFVHPVQIHITTHKFFR